LADTPLPAAAAAADDATADILRHIDATLTPRRQLRSIRRLSMHYCQPRYDIADFAMHYYYAGCHDATPLCYRLLLRRLILIIYATQPRHAVDCRLIFQLTLSLPMLIRQTLLSCRRYAVFFR